MFVQFVFFLLVQNNLLVVVAPTLHGVCLHDDPQEIKGALIILFFYANVICYGPLLGSVLGQADGRLHARSREQAHTPPHPPPHPTQTDHFR